MYGYISFTSGYTGADAFSYLGFELDQIISAFLINYELKSNWDFLW